MEAIIWGFIAILILVIVLGFLFSVDAPQREALYEHEELNEELSDKGSTTESLKCAKESYYQLVNSYEGIKDFASTNARNRYEKDIASVRSNAEDLAVEAWETKANKFLQKMENSYSLIVYHNFGNIENAYSSKSAFLKAYYAYFNWTRECGDENSSIWKNVNLWDEAKKQMAEKLNGIEGRAVWGKPPLKNPFVSRETKDSLTKHIEVMRPEYQRKMNLKNLILQTIADNGSIKRGTLLRTSYSGFIKSEIQACYRGLVNEHKVIEAKQGSLYFVSLTDSVAAKYPPKKKTEPMITTKVKKTGTKKQTTDSSNNDVQTISAISTNVLKDIASAIPVVDQKKVVSAVSDKIIDRSLSYKEALEYLNSCGVEYVNKTMAGGGLYFFGESEATALKDKGFPVRFAEKGTKGTGYRPAWYIKL